MKRIYFQHIFFLFFILGLYSCSKKLDITPQGAPSAGVFWNTKEDAQAGVNAMYRYFGEDNFYGRGIFWFINASDDMITGRVKPEADNIRNFNPSYIGGSYMEPQWKWRYAII
ncbi:MAG: RagB/SusD family nutrient uptake outer membrane protein, partial [Pseudopedobacter saltans]